MRKRPILDSPYDIHVPPRPWPIWRIALGLVLVLLSPVLLEAVRLCLSNWQAVTGRIEHVETPILDRVGIFTWGLLHSGRRWMHYRLHDLPWNPFAAMIVLLSLAFLVSIPLRRGPR